MKLTVFVTCFVLFGFCQDVCCMPTVSQEFLTTPQQDLSGKLYNVVSPKTDNKRILLTSPVSAINYHNRLNKETPHVALRILTPQDKTNEQHPVLIQPKSSENNSSLIIQDDQNVDSKNNNNTGDYYQIKEHELKSMELIDGKSIPKTNFQMGTEKYCAHHSDRAKHEKTHQRIHYRKLNEEHLAKPTELSSVEKPSSVSQEINNEANVFNNSPSKGKTDNIISTKIEDISNHLDHEASSLRSSKNNDYNFNKSKLNKILPQTSNTLNRDKNNDMQKPIAEQIQNVHDIVNTAQDNAVYHRDQTSPLTEFNTTAQNAPQRQLNSLDSEDHTCGQYRKPQSVPSFVNDADSDNEEDYRYIPVFDWPTRWFDKKTGIYYPRKPKLAGDGGTLNRQSAQQTAMKFNTDRANIVKQNLVSQPTFRNVILPLSDDAETQNVLIPMSFQCDVQNLDEPVLPLTYDPDNGISSPALFQPNFENDFTSFQFEVQNLNQPASRNQVLSLEGQTNTQNKLTPVSSKPEIQELVQSARPNVIQPLPYQHDSRNLNQPARRNQVLPLADQPNTQQDLTPMSFQPEFQESVQDGCPNLIQPWPYQRDIQSINQHTCPNKILPFGSQPEIQNNLAPASSKPEKVSDLSVYKNLIQHLKYQPDIQNFNQRARTNTILPLGYQSENQNVLAPVSSKAENKLAASNVIQPWPYQRDIQNINECTCPNKILTLRSQPEIQNNKAPSLFESEIQDLNQSARPNLIQPLIDFQNLNQGACPNTILPLGYQSEIEYNSETASSKIENQDSDQTASPNVIQHFTYQPDSQNLNQRSCPNVILSLGCQTDIQNDFAPTSSRPGNQDLDQSSSPNTIQSKCPNVFLPLESKPEMQNNLETASSKSENQESDQTASPDVIEPLTYQPDLQTLNQHTCPNKILPLEYQSDNRNVLSFDHDNQESNLPTSPNVIQHFTYQPDFQNLNQCFRPNTILPLKYEPEILLKAKVQDSNQSAHPNLILPWEREGKPDTPNELDPLTYQPDASNILPLAYRRPNIVPSNIKNSYNPDQTQVRSAYQYPFENELRDLHLTDVSENPDLQNTVINGQNPMKNLVYSLPRSYIRPNMVYHTNNNCYGLPHQYNQFDAFPTYSNEENFQKRPYYISNYRMPFIIGPSRLQKNDIYNQMKFPEFENCSQQLKSI